MQMLADIMHQPAQATGIIEILHEIGRAAGTDIADHRHASAVFFEIIEADRHAGAARHGDEMNDGVRRTAHRHGNGDAIRIWLASAAGMEEAPEKLIPTASAIAVMVLAVPMVMQVP